MEITANAVQTVAAGQNVVFTTTAVPSSQPCIITRQGSGITTLRGITTNSCRARFRASFSANIAVATGETPGPIQMAITMAGESIPESTMIVTPAAALDYFNVSASIFIDVPSGCCVQVSVENTSDIAVSVQNANFIVERVA